MPYSRTRPYGPAVQPDCCTCAVAKAPLSCRLPSGFEKARIAQRSRQHRVTLGIERRQPDKLGQMDLQFLTELHGQVATVKSRNHQTGHDRRDSDPQECSKHEAKAQAFGIDPGAVRAGHDVNR